MDLVSGVGSLPLDKGQTAVTVGFFDGVHRGHQAVIGRTVDVARQRGLVPVAVTFDRHPREILTPGKEPGLLTTMERKAQRIAALGIEALAILEFDEDFSKWPPEDFVSRVLVEGLSTVHTVVGSNFTFGHKAMGNLAVLSDLGAAFGFTVEGVALLKLDGRPVSSSSIREALSVGDLDWPARALGRRHSIDGVVTAGAGRGRGLGFPTANLTVPARILLPAEGVYAGKAFTGDEGWVAAINVGTNPTFGAEPLHVEAFLLDFEGDLIGRPVTVELWERLRDEVRFDSPDDLAQQIKQDVERTREVVR
jgi:riboflavin kinase / FMN adenylyltransferase